MLSIRGADQVCTSLRAARKSLADGGVTPRPRIDELDRMIGELAVGAPSYRGDATRSRTHIEAFVTSLSAGPEGVRSAGSGGAAEAAAGTPGHATLPAGLHDALAHFRRAVATLTRLETAQEPPVS